MEGKAIKSMHYSYAKGSQRSKLETLEELRSDIRLNLVTKSGPMGYLAVIAKHFSTSNSTFTTFSPLQPGSLAAVVRVSDTNLLSSYPGV